MDRSPRLHPTASRTSTVARIASVTAATALVASMAACGTVPDDEAAPELVEVAGPAQLWAEDKLADMTLDEKIGQLFVTYVYGATADTTDPDDVSRNQDWIGVDNGVELMDTYQLGGVIYFGWSDNLADPEQVVGLSNGLQDAALAQPAEVPLLISTDQEQGIVTRFGSPATMFPGSMAVAATGDPADARTAARITGSELRAVGINQDFAPVADVNINPDNPVIGVRSFGSEPGVVAELTAAQVNGFQNGAYSVAATAKHFPGHGDTDLDSHTDLPIIDHTRPEWEQWDAPPFTAAIDAGIDAIMTAHIQFPALDPSGDPATLSEPILTGLLREEMGYDGLIVTDSLSMAGVNELYPREEVPVRAIQAGADMLLMPPDLELAVGAVHQAVEDGEITEERIDESVTRILELKYTRGIVDKPHANPDLLDWLVGTPWNQYAADTVTAKTTTLVANDAGTLPLAADTTDLLVTGAGDANVANLAESLAEHGAVTNALPTGTAPDDSAIAEAVAAAGDAEAVVVATSLVPQNPSQATLVQALIDTGTPVIVVSVREPYDINRLPGAQTYIATYSYNAGALAAAADVIYGQVNPSGSLPVTIPTADDPDTPLYEFGHGLSY